MRKGKRKTLRRLLPWLTRDESCLARLAARGKLAELSVILQGLVLEHRLGLLRTYPSRPPGEKAKPNPKTTLGAKVKETPSPTAPELDPAPAPVPAPVPATLPAIASVPDETVRPPPAVAVTPKEALPEPSTPTVRRSFWPSSPWLRLQGFSVHTHMSGRWRSSDLWSLEAGGSLGWRSLFIRAGYQLPAQWSLEGRPVEVTSIPMLAGWRPTLWERSGWRLRGLAGAGVERIALRRMDHPQATWHSFWDAGLSAGAALAHAIGGGLQVAVLTEGTWFPAGQKVEIRDGPKTRFNQLCVTAAIQVSLGGDEE